MLIIMRLFWFTLILGGSFADWVSEWMTPVENEFRELIPETENDTIPSFAVDKSRVLPSNYNYITNVANLKNNIQSYNDLSPKYLKNKLEETLNNAKNLAAVLKKQILYLEDRERTLKQAIVDGKSGVTTLTVSSTGRTLHSYMIRDGFWSLCDGIIQYPNVPTSNTYTDLYSVPRCIGQEVTAKKDPCVFNSIIQYETIPITRRSSYYEDSYLCLKPTFNNTLQQYFSVPRRVVDDTCNGIIKKLTDNVSECGVRILSEYSYYPQNRQTQFPFEYCTEKDGSCRLMVGWHLSNKSIENFEFLKHDPNFKKFFIQTEPHMELFI